MLSLSRKKLEIVKKILTRIAGLQAEWSVCQSLLGDRESSGSFQDIPVKARWLPLQ